MLQTIRITLPRVSADPVPKVPGVDDFPKQSSASLPLLLESFLMFNLSLLQFKPILKHRVIHSVICIFSIVTDSMLTADSTLYIK